MKKAFFLGVVLLLVGAGCSTTANITTTPNKPADQPVEQTQVDDQNSDNVVGTQSSSTDSANDNDKRNGVGVDVEVKTDLKVDMATVKEVEFTIEGKNISYNLKEMKVKKGDKVKVTFVNSEGFHDWRLDGYNVGTKQISVGQSETVEFIADKVGTFEYFCSVGKHRAMGMKGNFIVE
ncbi:MAG: hypothetical protein COY69_02860 [Candidatus Magasanikbacteria bacterium CG_4_10_14_0_8_um_filter_32_14]|uniref:Blue (type 1) copper domain-containing protein n=1 Tax=Candidatus Magasanikbacteria bacterium CG_4_10_14_0_8_um_filter_32_14 TaxID=1974640 RepID=A0A2M7R8X3_9BACT|nr:MAG: hypothetical protein COY69_02860 [Candidatus Magasanikbacteria bacterium CG_4_10_14_0_8_um_filter_32_14]